MKLTAEDFKNVKLPLSQETFRNLQNLPPQEYNKLSRELKDAFQEYNNKEAEERGLLPWE